MPPLANDEAKGRIAGPSFQIEERCLGLRGIGIETQHGKTHCVGVLRVSPICGYVEPERARAYLPAANPKFRLVVSNLLPRLVRHDVRCFAEAEIDLLRTRLERTQQGNQA